MFRAAVVSFIAIGSCARLPALPSQGGPPWVELRSQHFVMWTDAAPERGHELVEEMEHFRSIIYGVAFSDLPAGGTTFVVAFRDFREARMYMPTFAEAVAIQQRGVPLSIPMIVLAADAHGDSNTVAHELTHAISFNAIHEQPRWYAEGIATFFQTVDLDAEHGTVELGRIPRDLGDDVLHIIVLRGLLPAASLFDCETCDSSLEDAGKFYGTAWALYAFLRNTRPRDLARFEHALNEMPAISAWRSVFPELTFAELDRALPYWLLNGTYQIKDYKISIRSWPIKQATLTDADIYGLRAMLDLMTHRYEASMRDQDGIDGIHTIHTLSPYPPLSGPKTIPHWHRSSLELDIAAEISKTSS